MKKHARPAQLVVTSETIRELSARELSPKQLKDVVGASIGRGCDDRTKSMCDQCKAY